MSKHLAAQCKGYFQLRPPAAATQVANIELASPLNPGFGAGSKTGVFKKSVYFFKEKLIQAAQIYSIAMVLAAMDGQSSAGITQHLHTDGLVKVCAGNMQAPISPWLHTLKRIKRMFCRSDRVGDFGTTGLDISTVGRHDQDTRMTLPQSNFEISPGLFMLAQFKETAVVKRLTHSRALRVHSLD